MAIVDFFLKIDGMEGESTDEKHKGEIDVLSWSWGESNLGSHEGGGGGGAGKVQMQDFNFSMRMNKATPKLFLACAEGKHIPKAVLTVRKAGGKQEEYYIVTFSDLLISSYQASGSQGDVIPTEQVSFNYSKIEMAYRPQEADGTLGSKVAAGWDLKKNVKA